MLGEGSFAKVYLVKKEAKSRKAKASRASSQGGCMYYAMKVLNKSILKQKAYFSYVKLER